MGQPKYAVDLVRDGSYSDAVGNRLLAAVAGLSGLVGWRCHDSGMGGPAQRYLVYGLQAAKASTDQRAPLLTVRSLADMGADLYDHADDDEQEAGELTHRFLGLSRAELAATAASGRYADVVTGRATLGQSPPFVGSRRPRRIVVS